MKTALILHGMPDRNDYYSDEPERSAESNRHWLPWLQHRLVQRDILTQTPEMPIPYAPNYKLWKGVFEQFTLHEDTILIGHSCGAGFLFRWLSEHDVKVGQVLLVAPWIDPTKELQAHGLPDFFDFQMDENLVSKTAGITIFGSDDDYPEIGQSIEQIMAAIPGIKFRRFSDHGHFTRQSMMTDAFPELLGAIVA
jgi:predicted alpha/beta hydrolase family esterase